MQVKMMAKVLSDMYSMISLRGRASCPELYHMKQVSRTKHSMP